MLCFPDDGSRKRFAKQLQTCGLPQLHCAKERQVFGSFGRLIDAKISFVSLHAICMLLAHTVSMDALTPFAKEIAPDARLLYTFLLSVSCIQVNLLAFCFLCTLSAHTIPALQTCISIYTAAGGPYPYTHLQEDDASCRVRLISSSPSPAGCHVVIVDDLMHTG